MAELNKYEQKHMAVIEPFLQEIQAFVNKHIISQNNSMVSGVIHQEFTKEYKKDIGQQAFVQGFKAAIKAGKITGIKSAKRRGYKRIDKNDKGQASDLSEFLDDLQIFVDENIKEGYMTTKDIYQGFFGNKGVNIREHDFSVAFSVAARKNKIKGIKGVKGKGYRRARPEEEPEDVPESDVEQSHTTFVIDSTRRLVPTDSLNWCFQVKKNSGIWVNEGYFSSIGGGVRALSKRMLDIELRELGEEFNVTELESKIAEAEERIAGLLTKAMGR